MENNSGNKENFIERIVEMVMKKLSDRKDNPRKPIPYVLNKNDKCPKCGIEMGSSEGRIGCAHYEIHDLEQPDFKRK